MENFRKVAVAALLGVLGFASLAAYDNYSAQGTIPGTIPGANQGTIPGTIPGANQGAYSQEDGNAVHIQAGYQQDSNQSGYYQDGAQSYQAQPSFQSVSASQQYYSDRSNDNSNEALGQRVLGAFQKDSSLSTPRNIQVTAFNGDITLTGSVRSDIEKSKAEQIAKQVSGVKSVTNKLSIRK